MGSTTAYFLRELGYGGQVTVYEPDPSYEKTSTFRSAAAIRQQFNLAINVAMSRFGAEFYEDVDSRLREQGSGIDFSAVPYLILAGKGDFERLRSAHARQVEVGADVDLLEPGELRQRYPWLAVDDIDGATVGRSGEGWFDPKVALIELRDLATAAGVSYVATGVRAIDVDDGAIQNVTLDDGTEAQHEWIVNAAGRHAGQVAAMAGVEVPVEARKRTAFVFGSDSDVPQVVQIVDRTLINRGLYVRPYGKGFMAVTSPAASDDAEDFGFAPHEALFDEVIKPALARRVPAFRDVVREDMWAGHYEINTFDQNAIIGRHPDVENLLLACGFSGHGVMHAPATARGIAELVISGSYQALDLSSFSIERIGAGAPMDDTQPSEPRVTK